MMKLFSLVFLALMLSSLPARAGSDGCYVFLSGDFLCPPPQGGLTTDLKGQPVCGPGQCIRNSSGEVRCAAEPGGAVVMDLNGRILCVGGCVKGDASHCVRPTP